MQNIRKLKSEIDESTARLQALQSELAALPVDHADDARAALQRRITAEQQLLERLLDIQRMAAVGAVRFSRARVLLAVAVLLASAVFALFKIKV